MFLSTSLSWDLGNDMLMIRDQNATELKDEIDSWNWTRRRHFDKDSINT